MSGPHSKPYRPIPPPRDEGAIERLRSKFSETQTGCWEFTSNVSGSGYARFTIGRIPYMAHRVAYVWLGEKELSVHLTLDHLCRNRRCVNPDHLEPVALIVNVMRGDNVGAVNARKASCPQCDAEFERDKDGNRFCPLCRAKRRSATAREERQKNPDKARQRDRDRFCRRKSDPVKLQRMQALSRERMRRYRERKRGVSCA